MATHNVTINVTPQTVRASELERESEKVEEERAQKGAAIAANDDYEAVSVKTLAVAGEPKAPPRKDKGAFARLKESHGSLKNAFIASGGKDGKAIAEKPAEAVTGQIKKLETELAALREKGDPKQIEFKEQKLQDLKDALQAYQGVLAEYPSAGTAATQTVRSMGEAEGAQTETSPQEKQLWNDAEKVAKSIGIDLPKGESPGGKEIDEVLQDFTKQMRGKVVELQSKVKELTAKQKDLETRLKSATTPAEKATLEKALKEVATQLKQVNQKILQCQKASVDFNTHADAILGLQVSKELGLTEKVLVKKPGAAPTVKTSSVTKGKGTTAASSPSPQPSPQQGEGVSASGLRIQSAETGSEGESGFSADAPLAQTMASDFSGTTLAIASSGNAARSEARKTDKILKKLLRAAMAGNFDAIKTALIFLDKRASLVTVGMGAQTIKAMQNYEKQMSALSGNIGKLKGTEPDYNAKLAKINSEMNQYSMNRQAISNFLRDTMSMKEEITNLTSSFLTKAGQISSTVSRWG